jgi:DNA-binding beta-propeller fold protein YncE
MMMTRKLSLAVLAVGVASCATKTPGTPAIAPSPIASTSPGAASAPAPAPTTSVVAASSAAPSAPASGPPHLVSSALPLPGANGPASLDYIFYEPSNARVWVPAGSTGSVDVLDVAAMTFHRIEGFKTAEREGHGKKRTVGPSAGSIGEGFAYIGNRATSEVCPIDVKTLHLGACLTLPSPTDGVVYVAPSKEVWVTLPREQTLAVLDASKPGSLRIKASIKVPGSPEGYAVDEGHRLFFTNLEDAGGTVAIDIASRQIKAKWSANCGPDGPRGVSFDAKRDFLLVACTDHVQVLDAGHGGTMLGRLESGAGVDNIDYANGTELVYVAAGKAARLTVARLDDQGQFTVVATADTSEGARNAVADANGAAYVTDSQQARILVFAPASSAATAKSPN